jgi:hypothetical protein
MGYVSWLFLLAVVLLCAVVGVSQEFLQCIYVSFNTTIVEQLKGRWSERKNPYRRGCVRNWEEVCGPAACAPLWCCPFPLPRVENGFGYHKLADDEELETFMGGF